MAVLIARVHVCICVAGCVHHGVHVFRLIEKVPKTDQKECEEATATVVEAMVHPDPLCSQVR